MNHLSTPATLDRAVLIRIADLLYRSSEQAASASAFTTAYEIWRKSGAGGAVPKQSFLPSARRPIPDGRATNDRDSLTGNELSRYCFCLQTALTLIARWPLCQTAHSCVTAHTNAQPDDAQTCATPSPLSTLWQRARRVWPLAFTPSVFDWWLQAAPQRDKPGNRLSPPSVLGPLLTERRLANLPIPGINGYPPLHSPNSIDVVDLIGPVYQTIYPPRARQQLGEFYTPSVVAISLIDELRPEQWANRIDQHGEGLVLDPACGSGVFLAAVVRRLALTLGPQLTARLLSRGLIAGIDVHPLAAVACRLRLNLLLPELHKVATGPKSLANAVATRDSLQPAVPAQTTCQRLSTDAPVSGPDPSSRRFHFVVGNPPYVRAARIPASYRAELRSRYETVRGAADLSVAFIEQAVRWTVPGGRIRLVISNKPLVARYGQHLLRFLGQQCSEWTAVPVPHQGPAFPDALIDTVVLQATRHSASTRRRWELQRSGEQCRAEHTEHSHETQERKGEAAVAQRSHSGNLPPNGSRPGPPYIGREATDLLHALEQASRPLHEFGALRGGVMGFHYRSAISLLREQPAPAGPPSGLPALAAGQIKPFHAAWQARVRLVGRWRRRLYLPTRMLPNILAPEPPSRRPSSAGGSPPPPFSPQLIAFSQAPKLLIRGIATRLTAAWDPHGCTFLVAVYGFQPHPNLLPSWLALALLNSPLLDFYSRAHLIRHRIPQGSWRFPKTFLSNLPLPALLQQPEVPPAAARAARQLQAWARKKHIDPLLPLPNDAQDASAEEPAAPATDRQVAEWTALLYGLEPDAAHILLEARARLT